MPKYIVQVRQKQAEGVRADWRDVRTSQEGGFGPPLVEASGPQEAFAVAVATGEFDFADDCAKPLVEGEYRVLPFGGGATFRVGLNVDETVHASEREVVAHGR